MRWIITTPNGRVVLGAVVALSADDALALASRRWNVPPVRLRARLPSRHE